MNHALRNHNTLTAIEPAMGFCNKISNLVSGALIVLSLVVWAAAIAASGGSWWLQFVFSGSAMLLLSAAFAFEMNRRLQEERSVMRYLDALCRASGRDSSDAAPNTARFSYCWLQIVRSLEELATSSARRIRSGSCGSSTTPPATVTTGE